MTKPKNLSQRTDKQQAIVDAAKKIIIARGFERLTVRAIAEELSVTEGALYRHFKSKHEIVSLLIDDVENSLLTVIEIPARFPGDPVGKLKKIFLTHVSNAEQRKGMTLIVINESLMIRDKIIKKKMLKVMSRYQEILKGVLREGIKSGKINKNVDVDAAGITFFGMIQTAVMFWALSDFSYHLKSNTLDRMFDQYVRGLAAR
jgi:AcrR family transcriptional regulator